MTEKRPLAFSQAASFFYTIQTGAKDMKNWKDRLIKCGIPEKEAGRIIDFFFKNRRTVELIAYVRMTEEALGKR